MSDIAKRLMGSVKYDAINGDAREKAICNCQMIEAATEITRLTAEVKSLRMEVAGQIEANELLQEELAKAREDAIGLKAKEQVLYDIHAALGIKWGDDPYSAINKLKEGGE